MTSVDRMRAYQLFDRALSLEGNALQVFLANECAGDAALLAEVRSLLAFAARDAGPTQALLGPAPAALEESLIGRVFGRFRLIERIGAGGMGVVFRAERTDGVPQTVAVKLLAGDVTTAGFARFKREARLLARLEHPAVARLIDTGVDAERAWIALEFIRGVPIDVYCEKQGLGLRERVALLVMLADAVAAAHRMLIVHRDIKPANVLVDESGQPKLIDFGIAATLPSGDAARDPTQDVARLFTPNYSAPEQLTGEPATVATDVFGLGALGYRLLSGNAPYPDASGPLRYMLAVSKEEVEAPSVVAARSAAGAARARLLRGDLDAVLQKALARDPAQRYASAAELRADLQRYLALQPVLARRSAPLDRLAKFVRRNALAVAAGAGAVAAVVAIGSVYAVQARHAADAREIAARRGEFLEKVLRSADPYAGRRDITVAEVLDSAAGELDRSPSGDPRVDASLFGVVAHTNATLGRFEEAVKANARQLDLLQTTHGDAVELARAIGARGEFLYSLDRWSEAEPLLRDAVTRLRAARQDSEACDKMLVLSSLLAHTRREREAEQLLHETIGILTRGGPSMRRQLVEPYRALAVGLGDQGRYKEAAEFGRKAYELGGELMAPTDPLRLKVEVNYAGALINVQREGEAEPLLRALIAKQSQVMGATHRDTLLSQISLSDDLYMQQKYAAAAELALATAHELDRQFGADFSYALVAWQTYGVSACRAGQVEAGLQAVRNVEEKRVRKYQTGDWRVASSGVAIGQCLIAARRYAEALPILLRAVAELEAVRGPAYRRTREAYAALRDVFLATGRSEDAARWAAKLGT